MTQEAKSLSSSDIALFKDMADIVRSRNVFFVPFFGAFLAFLVAKSQYIIDSNIVIQLFITATFLMGILYATIVSNFLYTLETLRFLYGAQLASEGTLFLELGDKERQAIEKAGGTIVPNMNIEARLFRWTMLTLYMTTFSVMGDIFFGKFIQRVVLLSLREFGMI